MMFGLSLSTVFRLFAGLIFAALIGALVLALNSRDYWRDIAKGVSVTLTDIVGKHVDPEDAAKVVKSVGVDLEAERAIRATQSARIVSMGEETKRLQALSAEWQEKALIAMADRDNAIFKLKTMAETPGDKANYLAQLREAEAALDLAYREGL